MSHKRSPRLETTRKAVYTVRSVYLSSEHRESSPADPEHARIADTLGPQGDEHCVIPVVLSRVALRGMIRSASHAAGTHYTESAIMLLSTPWDTNGSTRGTSRKGPGHSIGTTVAVFSKRAV